jgi:hypothetical protein
MKPLVSIPREKLAELLQASGSFLTPEQYLASLPPQIDEFRKYPGRAWAAAVSKYVLLLVAVLSVLSLPLLGFDIENVIIVIGLVTVTFFEYRVHRYFRECNPEAPGLGFRNQGCFAGAILVYCLYHATLSYAIPVPAEYREVMDPPTAALVQSLERVIYLIVGVVAGGSQFGLAWYYRTARE